MSNHITDQIAQQRVADLLATAARYGSHAGSPGRRRRPTVSRSSTA